MKESNLIVGSSDKNIAGRIVLIATRITIYLIYDIDSKLRDNN